MASADQDDDGNSVSIQKVENKPIAKQEVKDFRPQTVDAAKIETIIQGYAKALVIAGISEAQINEKIDIARAVSKQKPFDAFSKEYGDKIVKLKSMVKTEDIPF